MLIRYAPPTKEVSIVGSREDFTELSSLIRNGSGKMLSNQTGSPAPYEELLGAIVIENRPGEGVRFSVSQEGYLSIAGDKHKMAILAENVQSTAEADDVNGHWHEEYFPGHFYLAPDSFPVVLQFKIPGKDLSTLQ